MSQPVRISLDAMGGDHGPSVVVPGAALALERHPGMRFLMFGNERAIAPLVEADPRLKDAVEIRHTEVAVSMHDKPSQAVRAGRGKSSMWQAVQAVRDGQADAAVFDLDRPTVGLLNVGVEEIKGIEIVKEAARILKEADLPHLAYHGFVEGDDIGKGTVDVVVTEGFTGNIALKTAEGTAKQIGEYLKNAMTRTLMAKVGYLFAKRSFDALRDKMDPRKVNGGVFLGLDGVVIKSHGGTDALGFASAIDIAYDMAHYELMRTIREMLEQTPAVASA
jgi:fatty acid/phospholipid biosynthesis enzyme